MSDLAIKVTDLSKMYQLGTINTGTMSRDLNKWWARIRGKEDPYTTIGQINDRSKKAEGNYVWSLKDLNFEIKKGEAVGIIGRNGAGKSTLLKLLSRVTSPTAGEIKIGGRVASLLEVGTGFHPELTGRENIYMNGAILGMTKREISSKLDEIIAFSGVEMYIDTPVKRYSSGMYVRLAFAVAAHLEAEILIVDEVLAVGDAEFQKKCLGKMGEISGKEGRTVLFVSHNLGAIVNLCNHGLYLKNGNIGYLGNIDNTLKKYADDRIINSGSTLICNDENEVAWLKSFGLKESSFDSDCVRSNDSAVFIFEIESRVDCNNVCVGIGVNDSSDIRVVTLFSKFYNVFFNLRKGTNHLFCQVDSLCLKPGNYNVEVFIGDDHNTYDYYDKGLQIQIENPQKDLFSYPDMGQGNILLIQSWNYGRKNY